LQSIPFKVAHDCRVSQPQSGGKAQEGVGMSKARDLILQQIGGDTIIAELKGQTKYVLLTGRAVYICQAGLLTTTALNQFPLDTISSVEISKSLLAVDMQLTMAGGTTSASNIHGFIARALKPTLVAFKPNQLAEVNKLAKAILDAREARKVENNRPANSQSSSMARLTELKQLLDAGLVSKEEFEQTKRRLLGQM